MRIIELLYLHINNVLLKMLKPKHLLIFLFSPAVAGFSQTNLSYPPSQKQQVVDYYFGTKVEDPYRWLEDDRGAQTGAWLQQQNSFTNTYLKQITGRDKIKNRLTELWNYSRQSTPYKKGNSFFCFKNNGLQNQSVMYIKKSLEDAGEILLDPNSLSTDGTISLSGTSVSKDGKTLA